MKIISITLVLISAFLSFKHGWDAFHPGGGEQANMMAGLGISKSFTPFIGIFSVTIGLTLFFPQTFFTGNLLNAVAVLIIMTLAVKAGNIKIALIEIPFLAMPLLLAWLGYPFKFR